MHLKLFSLPFDLATGRFDDAEVQAFLHGKVVLDVQDHFTVHAGRPLWVLRVLWAPGGEPAPGDRRSPDWRTTLTEPPHVSVFDAVRAWRNARAEAEGKPPFALLTNRQVADIAKASPGSLAALRGIQGIGEARVRDFGQELLAVIAGALEAAPGPIAEPTDGP